MTGRKEWDGSEKIILQEILARSVKLKLCTDTQEYRRVMWAEMPSVNRGSFKHFCRFMNKFVLKINTGSCHNWKTQNSRKTRKESAKPLLYSYFLWNVQGRFYSHRNSLETVQRQSNLISNFWIFSWWLLRFCPLCRIFVISLVFFLSFYTPSSCPYRKVKNKF